MKNTFLTLLAIVLAVSCGEKKQPQPFSVIPMPNDVTITEGSFNVAGAFISHDENLDAASLKAVDDFIQTVTTVTGSPMRLRANGNEIHFGLNPNMGAEEYFLKVTPEYVNVEASAFGGFFYAIQTLKQMLPAEGPSPTTYQWNFSCSVVQLLHVRALPLQVHQQL